MKKWDKKTDETFVVHLQSSSTDGLTIPPLCAKYIIQYKNSLKRKHFKSLQQLGMFHLHGLCDDRILNLWKGTGELGAMLWYHKIKGMDAYLVSCDYSNSLCSAINTDLFNVKC